MQMLAGAVGAGVGAPNYACCYVPEHNLHNGAVKIKGTNRCLSLFFIILDPENP
jgi:hypothetical protein